MEVFQSIPDPRKARGKRYSLAYLLVLISAAMAAGQKAGRGIAQWIQLHASEVIECLDPPRESMPSASTIRRTMRDVDTEVLEEAVSILALRQASCREGGGSWSGEAEEGEDKRLQGMALDGKELRGVRAHGQPMALVSLTEHSSGIVCGQQAVEQGSNEITAAPKLLEGKELQGKVITMDALHTQRALAEQILEQGGDYLMVVKDNQPELRASIALLFDEPPWLPRQREQECQGQQTVSKGHGRLETRVLETSNALSDYLDWPGVAQVMRRSCRRVKIKTGEVEHHTSYGITSLPWLQVDAAQIEALWRGHWTIENRVHYVRDVTMGEDACHMRSGNAPHTMAILRNALLSLFRHRGWSNIADALRYYAANFSQALELVGAVPDRL
jgi:predicted transposase YbfD/YdcC